MHEFHEEREKQNSLVKRIEVLRWKCAKEFINEDNTFRSTVFFLLFSDESKFRVFGKFVFGKFFCLKIVQLLGELLRWS